MKFSQIFGSGKRTLSAVYVKSYSPVTGIRLFVQNITFDCNLDGRPIRDSKERRTLSAHAPDHPQLGALKEFFIFREKIFERKKLFFFSFAGLICLSPTSFCIPFVAPSLANIRRREELNRKALARLQTKDLNQLVWF